MTAEPTQPLMISIVVPVHNGAQFLPQCLQAVQASNYPHYECIVVDDGSTDASRTIASQFPVRVLPLPSGPFGPAYARNRGAELACGEVVFFTDADVRIKPDTLTRIAETFTSRPDVDALFGSYDDSPGGAGFLSRYKNLFHHFVHQQANQDAATFWSGCGAVRRKTFYEIGGFDEVRYSRSSIEDIDLGYRLKAAGRKVILDKSLQAQHLKEWSLRGMLVSDVRDRALPWTALILRNKRLPNDLNLRFGQRICAIVTLLYLGLIAYYHNTVLLPLLAALFVLVVGSWTDEGPIFRGSPRAAGFAYLLIGVIAGVAWYLGMFRVLVLLAVLMLVVVGDRLMARAGPTWRRIGFGAIVVTLAAMTIAFLESFSFRLGLPLLSIVVLIVGINRGFYTFLSRKQGILFALATIPFHLMYYVYSMAAFVAGFVLHTRNGSNGKHTLPNRLRPLGDGEPVPPGSPVPPKEPVPAAGRGDSG